MSGISISLRGFDLKILSRMANTSIANLTLADDTCSYFRILSAKTDERGRWAREIGRETPRSPSDAMQEMNTLNPVIFSMCAAIRQCIKYLPYRTVRRILYVKIISKKINFLEYRCSNFNIINIYCMTVYICTMIKIEKKRLFILHIFEYLIHI